MSENSIVVQRAGQSLYEYGVPSHDVVNKTLEPFKNLYQKVVKNKEDRKEVHDAYMSVRSLESEVKGKGKAAREDANAFAKAVIQVEKEILEPITSLKEALKQKRDEFDEAEKAAQEAKNNRVSNIERSISSISDLVKSMALKPSLEIESAIASLEAKELTDAEFQEFLPKATEEKASVLFILKGMAVQAKEIEKKAQNDEPLKLAEKQLASAQLEKEKALRESAESKLEAIKAKQSNNNDSPTYQGSDKEKLQAYIGTLRKAASSKPALNGNASELINWFEKNLDKLLTIVNEKVEEL